MILEDFPIVFFDIILVILRDVALKEKKRVEKKELRFATTKPASGVISRIEEVGKTKNFSIRKSESCVRLQEQQNGRIAADIFTVTPWFLVVEVNKSSGDTLDYNHFSSMELWSTLKDIEWTSTVTTTSSESLMSVGVDDEHGGWVYFGVRDG